MTLQTIFPGTPQPTPTVFPDIEEGIWQQYNSGLRPGGRLKGTGFDVFTRELASWILESARAGRTHLISHSNGSSLHLSTLEARYFLRHEATLLAKIQKQLTVILDAPVTVSLHRWGGRRRVCYALPGGLAIKVKWGKEGSLRRTYDHFLQCIPEHTSMSELNMWKILAAVELKGLDRLFDRYQFAIDRTDEVSKVMEIFHKAVRHLSKQMLIHPAGSTFLFPPKSKLSSSTSEGRFFKRHWQLICENLVSQLPWNLQFFEFSLHVEEKNKIKKYSLQCHSVERLLNAKFYLENRSKPTHY